MAKPKTIKISDTGQVITAFNLATGEELTFHGVVPSEAVIFAHLYSTGNKNTWEWNAKYFELYPKLTWGSINVGYMDWCAKR